MKHTIYKHVPAFALVLLLILPGCEKSKSVNNDAAQNNSTSLNFNGHIVKIENPTTQIQASSAETKGITAELIAPCRIFVSAARSSTGNAPIYLFDNKDISELYSNLVRTRSSLEKSRNQVDRLRELVKHQAAAGKELIDAETDTRQLEASLAELESKMNLEGLDFPEFERILPGNVLLLGEIPETKINSIRVGNNVTAIFNSYPTEKFSNKVLSIGKVIDPVTRSVKALVSLQNKDGKLLTGMYGQLLLGINDYSAITVPVSSVFSAQGKYYLFIEKSSTEYELREVKTGVQNDESVEIQSGISPQDKIVNRGVMLLKSLSFGY